MVVRFILLYTSPWSRLELTTSVGIGTDYLGMFISNNHTTASKVICQNDDNEGEHVITSGSKQKVILTLNGTGGVMVSEFTSSVVDRRFEPLSGQTKDFNICIGGFSTKHTPLWRQNKDWSCSPSLSSFCTDDSPILWTWWNNDIILMRAAWVFFVFQLKNTDYVDNCLPCFCTIIFCLFCFSFYNMSQITFEAVVWLLDINIPR
jgi:hypothetical protein